jgi:hypothetical protein
MTSPDPGVPDREVEIGPVREASTAPPAQGSPVDHSREAPAMSALRRRGFTAEFLVEGDTLRVAGTSRRLRPEEVWIVDHYRFEGTSDPDDMSVIYALEARDGTRGTLSDAFGPYADPAIGAILDRLGIARTRGGLRWHRVVIRLALGAVALSGLAVLARRLRAAS